METWTQPVSVYLARHADQCTEVHSSCIVTTHPALVWPPSGSGVTWRGAAGDVITRHRWWRHDRVVVKHDLI